MTEKTLALRATHTTLWLVLVSLVLFMPGAWAQDTDNGFTLNLKDADISALVATVSKVTGKNFVLDPRVQGKVTIVSANVMTPDEMYTAFLSALNVQGFTAVSAGDVTKIVPQVGAVKDGGFGNEHKGPEAVITKVIHVDNVPVKQLIPDIRPLVPEYGHLAAVAGANSIIVSDRRANVQRIEGIIRKLDLAGHTQVQSIRVRHADAKTLLEEIRHLKQDAIEHGGLKITADSRTNSIIVNGNASQRMQIRNILGRVDGQVEAGGRTDVIYLDYAGAKDIAPVLDKYAQAMMGRKVARKSNGEKSEATGSQQVLVVPEPQVNALVITAPQTILSQLTRVVNKIDIPRKQVMLQVVIAEVSLSESKRLGVNLGVFNKGKVAAASILDSHTLQAIPSLALDGTPLNLIQSGLNVALGGTSGGANFAMLINALSGNANTQVLSAPSLVALNNEKASISVGKKVPFVTGQYSTNLSDVSETGMVNPFQTIERKKVGLSMEFTPRINSNDIVQMGIDLSISNIARNTGINGAVGLITNLRAMTTSVSLKEGQVLVLGGLISNNLTETETKVPLLGDIPVVGSLFRNKSMDHKRQNLLVFIRPVVLGKPDLSPSQARKRYDKIMSLIQDPKSMLPTNLDIPVAKAFSMASTQGKH